MLGLHCNSRGVWILEISLSAIGPPVDNCLSLLELRICTRILRDSLSRPFLPVLYSISLLQTQVLSTKIQKKMKSAQSIRFETISILRPQAIRFRYFPCLLTFNTVHIFYIIDIFAIKLSVASVCSQGTVRVYITCCGFESVRERVRSPHRAGLGSAA